MFSYLPFVSESNNILGHFGLAKYHAEMSYCYLVSFILSKIDLTSITSDSITDAFLENSVQKHWCSGFSDTIIILANMNNVSSKMTVCLEGNDDDNSIAIIVEELKAILKRVSFPVKNNEIKFYRSELLLLQ